VRRIRWLVIVVVALIVVRERTIRRHEAEIGVWPRVDGEVVAA
jgi:hypothetical protein